MPNARDVAKVADILTDPANADRSAEEVAAQVLELAEAITAARYKYVTVSQDRAKPLENGRTYHPTWVRGPFSTLQEAGEHARDERKRTDTETCHTMCARLYAPDAKVPVELLKEIIR